MTIKMQKFVVSSPIIRFPVQFFFLLLSSSVFSELSAVGLLFHLHNSAFVLWLNHLLQKLSKMESGTKLLHIRNKFSDHFHPKIEHEWLSRNHTIKKLGKGPSILPLCKCLIASS